MMNDGEIELSPLDKDSATAMLNSSGESLSDLVSLAGLDKASDFIEANLSDLDFSGSDLRGFNFKRANLTGATGLNVRMDHTTVLDDAKTDRSIFKLAQDRQQFVKVNKGAAVLLRRLESEYWTNGSLWITNNLKRGSKDYETNVALARFLYQTVDDQSYKSHILYALKSTFTRDEDYRDFLLTQLLDPNVKPRSLRTVLTILGRAFGREKEVRETMFKHLDHPYPEARSAAFEYALRRDRFFGFREFVQEKMLQEPVAFQRQYYTSLFSSMVMSDPWLFYRRGGFHDYKVEIDDDEFRKIGTGMAVKRVLSTRNFDLTEVHYRIQHAVLNGYPCKCTYDADQVVNSITPSEMAQLVVDELD